jgi:hypothetical protein
MDLRQQILAQLDRAVPASKSHEVFDALLRATRAEVELHDEAIRATGEGFDPPRCVCDEPWPCRYLRDLSTALGEMK